MRRFISTTLLFIIISCTLIILKGCGKKKRKDSDYIKDLKQHSQNFHPPVNTIYYSNNKDTLNVKIHKPIKARATKPAIILFSGGGWRNSVLQQFDEHAEYFASRGMTVIQAEYRTKKDNEHPVTSIKDAKRCLQWVHNHADSLNINPENIVIGGASTGGYLALSTELIQEFSNITLNYSPKAFLLFNPVVNTDRQRFRKKFGKFSNQASLLNKEIDTLAPTLIFHGANDSIVPYPVVRKFRDKLQKEDIFCRLTPFFNQSHGFFNYSRNRSECKQTIYLTHSFFQKFNILQSKIPITYINPYQESFNQFPLKSFWNTSEISHKNRLEIVKNNTRLTKGALKISLHSKDRNGGANRSEIKVKNPAHEGSKLFYAFSVKIPEEYIDKRPDNVRRTIITQWHEEPDVGLSWSEYNGHPPSIVLLYKGKQQNGKGELKLKYGLNFNKQYVFNLKQINKGQWYDLAFKIHWSQDQDGFMKAWFNGNPWTLKSDSTVVAKGANMYNNVSHNIKMGLYRGKGLTTKNHIYFDEFRIGNSMSEVNFWK